MNTLLTTEMNNGIGLPSSQTRSGRIICLSALCLLTRVAPALALQSGDFTYELNPGNTTVTITGYTGPGGAVTIPDNIISLPVTSIGEYVFQNYYNLTHSKTHHFLHQ